MLVENCQFELTPPLFGARVRGDSIVIFPKLWDVLCVIPVVAVLVQYRRMSDGRTDRHTTTAYTALA